MKRHGDDITMQLVASVRRRLAWIAAIPMVSIGLLAGCGGGGGSSSAPSSSVGSTNTAEGVYQGATSSGWQFDAIVLEDGSLWSIYGTQLNGGLAVTGLFTGSGSSNNGSYTATTNDFPAPGSTGTPGTLVANYVTGSTMNGTIQEPNQTVTFNGSVRVASTYDYNTSANPSAVSGSWSGKLLDGESATITVSSSGAISGASSGGCAFTGSITPRPSGKNVYNVTLNFGGSPCFAANASANGIALLYPISGGLTQLVAAAVDGNGTAATAFFAQR